jgi:hypothetical protein
MNFNLLMVNILYPQNFYEMLRVFCSLYVSVIPPWNEVNDYYTYKVFYATIDVNLVNPLNLQFYRVGFAGYVLTDLYRTLFFIILLWILVGIVLR